MKEKNQLLQTERSGIFRFLPFLEEPSDESLDPAKTTDCTTGSKKREKTANVTAVDHDVRFAFTVGRTAELQSERERKSCATRPPRP